MSQTQTLTTTGIHSAPDSLPLSVLPPPKSSTPQRLPTPSSPPPLPPHRSPPSSTTPTQPVPHLRLLSCILAFFAAGLNDGSLGPLTPYFLRHYALPLSSASWLYLSSFTGWLLIALTNSHLTANLRPPGILLLGSLLQILGQALRAWAPPFGLYAASFAVVSLGQALQDSAANAFVAGVGRRAHRWLGAVHAAYGLGGMVGGLLGAAVAGGGGGDGGGGDLWWAGFYWVAMGVGVGNSGLVIWAFRRGLGKGAREDGERAEDLGEEEGLGRNRAAWVQLMRAVRSGFVWAMCAFYFFYLGTVITVGGELRAWLNLGMNAVLMICRLAG